MAELRVLGVIPARLHSSRLPRKVLRPIGGLPMLVHVFLRARRAKCLHQLVVATDADEVRQLCQSRHIPVLMTAPEHPSGTDRVYEVLVRRQADVVVNIQADEPLICSEHVEALIRPFADASVQVTTLRVPLGPSERHDPSCVKVVCSRAGDALYFSRSLIPFDRDGSSPVHYYKHLGLYAYRRQALRLFHELGPSPLEQAEKLEQLRFLENGVRVRVVDAPYETVGVDTEQDLARVEQIMQRASTPAA